MGTEWVEGVYVFPLPDEAAVDHLRMTIGERIIEGEIREKAQAKKEYEQAKAEGKKASLVDAAASKPFSRHRLRMSPPARLLSSRSSISKPSGMTRAHSACGSR